MLYTQSMIGQNKLYLLTGYMKYDEEFKDRIISLNIFEEVLLISERSIKNKVAALVDDEGFEELTRQQREKQFDQVIFDHYEDFLCKNVAYYFFNQTSMIYYYVVRKQLTASIIEDGYKSLITQNDYVAFVSHLAKLNKFINDGYISLAIECNSVSEVIGSDTLEEVNRKDFKNKYKQQNFIEMLKCASKETINKLFKIFEYQHLDIPSNSALILTQPLASFRYCYADEQYLLYKKMINDALKKVYVVHIKPHPGDRNIYQGLSSDRVRIIDGKFPIELLIFNQSNYDYIYSFDSTVIGGLDANKEKINIFSRESRMSVMDYIREYTKDQKIVVGINDSVSDREIEKLNASEKYAYKKISGNSQQEIYRNARQQICDYVYYNDKKATVNILKLFKVFEKAMQANCREIFLTGVTHVIGNEKFNNVIFASRYYYKYFFNKIMGIQVLEAYVRGGNHWVDVIRKNYKIYPSNRIRVELDLQGEARELISKDEYDIFLLAKKEKARLEKTGGVDIEKKYFVSIDKYLIEWMYLLNASVLDREYDVIKYISFLDNEERDDLLRSIFDHSLKPKKIGNEKKIREESGKEVDIKCDVDTEVIVKKARGLKQKLKSTVNRVRSVQSNV